MVDVILICGECQKTSLIHFNFQENNIHVLHCPECKSKNITFLDMK